jgi:AcrR family transcriptional regulator
MFKVSASDPQTLNLRQINVEMRRQQILTAARQLISRGGMAALSMRKLAKESRLSVTTLYNLFGVREAILQALVEDSIDRMDQILEEEAPLDDPLERCRAVITVSIRHLVENEAIFRPMLIAAHQGFAPGSFEEGRITQRATRMQAIAIEAAIERGLLIDFLDPSLLGRQIYHGYELASAQWAFGALDAAGFRTRALYGLYVSLLGVATNRARPGIESELRKLEKAAPTRSGGVRARPDRANPPKTLG